MKIELDQNGQLKVEADRWYTYFDDEIDKCWMMAELVRRECRDCSGTGEVQLGDDVDDTEPCATCHETGWEILDIRWDDAITCEEWLSVHRQTVLLVRRYGTPKPSSIVDYWLAS